MKILSVIDTFTHGGAESVAVNLILGMPQHSHMLLHSSGFFNVEPSAYLIARLKEGHIAVKDFDYSCFRKSEILNEILKTFSPDIVMYHWWGNDPLSTWREAVRADGLHKPKFICVVHSIKPNKLVQPGYDFYATVSFAAGGHQRHIPSEKTRIIYNGIDVKKFDVAIRREDNGKFVIGRVSALNPKKIPADWIKIANTFNINGASFVIAGDGPLKDILIADVEKLGVQHKFLLPGYVNQYDLPSLLGTFSICCYITTTCEANSLALIECAVAGLPIVAQPRGGIPEQVVHGKTGFLSEDINGIKYYCGLLARDASLRKEMSAKARQFGRRFSIERQCQAYDKLFKELIYCG